MRTPSVHGTSSALSDVGDGVNTIVAMVGQGVLGVASVKVEVIADWIPLQHDPNSKDSLPLLSREFEVSDIAPCSPLYRLAFNPTITTMSHFLQGKTIIVAGGGMSGLSFASALRKLWPSSVPSAPKILIYERDTKEDSVGREGYSMTLAGYDETGGLYGLMQLGLLDEALKHAVVGVNDSGRIKAWTSEWKELLSMKFKPAKGLPTSFIRIARKNLRKLLIEATDGINWDVAVKSVKRLENGRLAVTVARNGGRDESIEECDLLVAADGASSYIRRQLRPHDNTDYNGATQLLGQAFFSDKIPSPIDEHYGRVVTGEGVCCFFSAVDKNNVVWAISRLEPNTRPKLDKSSEAQCQAVIDECLQMGHMIAEPFSTIVRATTLDSVLVLPAKDKHAFRHDLSELGNVIFIGDSNHALSPFAGYGASLALKDGWDLAEQLCNADSLEQGVNRYDDIGVPRAEKIWKQTRGRIAQEHVDGVQYYMLRVLLVFGSFVLWITGQS